MRIEPFVLGLGLLLSSAGAPAALYKWIDEKGRTQYSDKPPAQTSKGGVEMSNRGIVKKKLEAELTPEEKKAKADEAARRRAEQQEAVAQRRSDNALLLSFSSVEEIDMKRDRELQAIDAIIANLRSQERSVIERWNDDRKRADIQAKRGKPLPDGIKEDLARSEGEAKVIREEIQRRNQEAQDTRVKYQALRKRYADLRQSAAAHEPATAGALPASAPSKK